MAQAQVGVSAPDLSTSLVSFQTIKDNAKQTLLDIFESAPCPQALIVDPILTNPIGLICPVKEMRLHKVQEILLLGGEERTKSYQSFHTIFLLRPNPELILQVKDIIFHHRAKLTQQQSIHASKDPNALQQKITFSIYFVPRRSLICESILSRYELTTDPDITFAEYPLDLIPCDGDLLSLELPNVFTKIFIDGDTSVLFTIALSVIRLQVFFGVIPLIKGIGKASHRVAELIHRLSCELLVTSHLHAIDFGAQNGSTGPEHALHTAESTSYSLFSNLTLGSTALNQGNHSMMGVLSLNTTLNTTVQPNQSNMNNNQQQVIQQQQKQSLSTQLSSLLSVGSSSETTTDATQTNDKQPPNPYDISQPRVNISYASNPIINSYSLPQITQVMFIDRTADMISPMLLQRTYEGLMDELYGINTQTIEYEPAEGSDDANNSKNIGGTIKKKKMSLHNADVLFAELRDVNIKILGQMFSEKWGHIKSTYAKTEGFMSNPNAQIKLSEMEKVVKQFKNVHLEHQLLPIHWNFAQKIKDFFASRYIMQLKSIEEALLVENNPSFVEKWIDEAIMKSLSLDKVLRIMILYAAMHGSIPLKKANIWRRDMVQTYGPEIIPLLSNLQQLGVLYNTTPISDEASIHQYMVQQALLANSSRPGVTSTGSIAQTQRENMLKFIETSKPISNNEMNLHIALSRTGSAPNAPIIRKPLWDKISGRLKLVQTEEVLLTTQQAIFNKQQPTPQPTTTKNIQETQRVANIQTLFKEPIDINFGYGNFYSPLSIRFVEMAAQPHGLKRLQDQLQISSLLFHTPYQPTESSTSTIFSSITNSNTTNLTTTLTQSGQLAPSSTTPNTPAITPTGTQSTPTASASGLIHDQVANTTNFTITPPTIFEYRQSLPLSLQQRMQIPDPHYFQYPLLSTTLVPQTQQQLVQQSQIDIAHAQFLPTDSKKTTQQQDKSQQQDKQPQNDKNQDDLTATQSGDENKKISSKPICLVYFVGGATHAEVSMLRYLTEHPTHKFAYVVATTKMINSKTLINDLQRGVKEIGRILD